MAAAEVSALATKYAASPLTPGSADDRASKEAHTFLDNIRKIRIAEAQSSQASLRHRQSQGMMWALPADKDPALPAMSSRHLAICDAVASRKRIKDSRQFLKSASTFTRHIALCCSHMSSRSRRGAAVHADAQMEWGKFPADHVSMLSAVLTELELDPLSFTYSEFLRIAMMDWDTLAMVETCAQFAVSEVLESAEKAFQGQSNLSSLRWREVARFVQRLMGFVWTARKAEHFLVQLARHPRMQWRSDIAREVKAFVMPAYHRHRRDCYFHVWNYYFKLERSRKKQQNHGEAFGGPGNMYTVPPHMLSTASPTALKYERNLRGWHTNPESTTGIIPTMTPVQLRQLFGPIGWGQHGVLDVIRLHGIASSHFDYKALEGIQCVPPTHNFIQFGATLLHMYSWHGQGYVVEFLVKNRAPINALDNGTHLYVIDDAEQADAPTSKTYYAGTPLDYAMHRLALLRRQRSGILRGASALTSDGDEQTGVRATEIEDTDKKEKILVQLSECDVRITQVSGVIAALRRLGALCSSQVEAAAADEVDGID